MRIGNSTPVDRAAARALGTGYAYTPAKKIVVVHSETPLPTIPIMPDEHDLKGLKFGWFTVTGKFSVGNGGRGALWAVRCVCGRYTVRTSKAIRNPSNSGDCCEECRHTTHLKSR